MAKIQLKKASLALNKQNAQLEILEQQLTSSKKRQRKGIDRRGETTFITLSNSHYFNDKN